MSVARSSFLFTIGTFLSRISGLARDSILSGVFGASSSVEAFFVANRIPNLFRDMLAEGALGSSFTKVYTSISVADEERAHRLLCDAFRLGMLFLLFITAFGVLAAPVFVDIMTMLSSESGRPPEFYRETVNLTRILFPFLGFAIMAALAGGVLQQRGRFFLTAVSSSALNLGYIIGSLVFAQLLVMYAPANLDQDFLDRRILGLAIGVVLGGAFHFLVQLISIWKDLIKTKGWSFSRSLFGPDLRRVFILMAPAAIASSAGSLNLLINTNFATGLGTGAVTWLNYAFRLLQLPIGIFAVAVGSVSLPSLTRAVANAGNKVDDKVSAEIGSSCEFINWLMFPCLAFLVCNSLPTVQLIFQHGKFDYTSAVATSSALYAYSFGVVGYGLIKVLSSFYYAVERTSYAMMVSLSMVVLNFVCNALLVKEFGHVGLAATSSICLTGNALLLSWGLKKHGVRFDPKQMRSYLWMFLALLLSILVQMGITSVLNSYKTDANWPLKAWSLLEVCLGGLAVVAVFGGFGLMRLNLGPKQAFAKFKSLRRRRG